jgi:hypothetical protein
VNPGDVFRWINFPHPKYGGGIKPRWFIYLGDTNPILEPNLVYICTTTTNIQDFQKGGRREFHCHFIFKKGKHPFDEECLVDFDEDFDAFPKGDLEGNPDIEPKGPLDVRTLRVIYEGILVSERYSRKNREDIYFSLKGLKGIGSLRKP